MSNKKKHRFLLLLCFASLVMLTAGCFNNKEDKQIELTISAAASLAEALAEVKAGFEKANPTIKINYSFGSSGSLQEQIIQGAPVDLFISAAEDKFEQLVEEGLISKEDSNVLLTNELVLISSKEKENIHSFQDLLNEVDRISIGIPESVPAGKYAKEVLQAEGLWDQLQGKIVYAKDVRQVLTYVETKNVDAGIVYHTDALLSQVKIVSVAEEGFHTPIVYPLGVISNTDHKLESRLYYEYLQSEEALVVFEKYGFRTIQGNQ